MRLVNGMDMGKLDYPMEISMRENMQMVKEMER